MAIILSPEGEQQRQKRLSEVGNEISSANDAIASVTGTQAELGKTDSLNTEYWNYYNNICTNYEMERKYIDGLYISAPVLLSEVQNASLYSGRLHTNGVMPVTRIPEFDFGNTTSGFNPRENLNAQRIQDAFTWLVDGFNDGGSSPAATLASIGDGSTSVTTNNNAGLNIGSRYVVADGSRSAVVVVDSVVGVSSPYTLNFHYYDFHGTILGPSGVSIGAGATFSGSNSFSDGERGSRSAGGGRQNLLENSFLLLELALQERKDSLSAELNFFTSNQDDGKGTAASDSVSGCVSGIDTFRASPDFSDSGMASVSAHISNRNTFFPTRILQIMDRLSGAGDYYDTRYNVSNLIGDKRSGSYGKYVRTGQALDGLNQDKQGLEAASGIYAS